MGGKINHSILQLTAGNFYNNFVIFLYILVEIRDLVCIY